MATILTIVPQGNKNFPTKKNYENQSCHLKVTVEHPFKCLSSNCKTFLSLKSVNNPVSLPKIYKFCGVAKHFTQKGEDSMFKLWRIPANLRMIQSLLLACKKIAPTIKHIHISWRSDIFLRKSNIFKLLTCKMCIYNVMINFST